MIDPWRRSDILLNVFLAIAVDNLAGGDGDKEKKWVTGAGGKREEGQSGLLPTVVSPVRRRKEPRRLRAEREEMEEKKKKKKRK